jgi:murein endopeptidase
VPPSADNPPAGPALASALVLALLLAAVPVLLHGLRGEAAGAAAASVSPPAATPPAAVAEPDAGDESGWPPVAWHSSRAVGLPNGGRLVRGVQLPAEGADYFTFDLPLKRAPNRGWRRWGTDALVRTVLRVAGEYRVAHPEAPRVGIADLSRPNGGEFGPRFGGLGHASHQNGLDVDVLYPRLDQLERAPIRPAQIDRALAQDLVDRFVKAGAVYAFVGPHTGLRGPSRIVQELEHHDDHVHVRIAPPRR